METSESGKRKHTKNWASSIQENVPPSSIEKLSSKNGKRMCKSTKYRGMSSVVLAFTFEFVQLLNSQPGHDMCRSLCTKPVSSSAPCWRHNESRRSGGGNIHVQENRNQKRRKGRLLSPNKHSLPISSILSFTFHRTSFFLSSPCHAYYHTILLSVYRIAASSHSISALLHVLRCGESVINEIPNQVSTILFRLSNDSLPCLILTYSMYTC